MNGVIGTATRARQVLLTAAACWLAVAGGACGGEEPAEAPVAAVGLPPVEGPRSPAWSPTPTADDPAVATVDGVPILRSQLERALADEPAGTAPEDVLERLVELEVLAREALAAGYYRPEIVQDVHETALVRELIAERFLRRPPASFFTDDMIRHIYYDPRVRLEFDHVDAFKVADAQFVCCPRRYDECKPEAFAACMEEEEAHVRAVYEDLATLEDPDRETFATRVEQWETTYRRLNLKSYSFFYNVNLPHEEQSGYDIVNENVAKAAMSVAVGEIAEPVRSRNGWHILYLVRHDPEEHRGPDDPDVRAEIIAGALPKRQEAEYAAWMKALREVHDVVLHPENLQVFLKGMQAVR